MKAEKITTTNECHWQRSSKLVASVAGTEVVLAEILQNDSSEHPEYGNRWSVTINSVSLSNEFNRYVCKDENEARGLAERELRVRKLIK